MKRVFILKGLDCPNCSAKIEKEVGALPGVESSVVNLMQQTLTVQSERPRPSRLSFPAPSPRNARAPSCRCTPIAFWWPTKRH